RQNDRAEPDRRAALSRLRADQPARQNALLLAAAREPRARAARHRLRLSRLSIVPALERRAEPALWRAARKERALQLCQDRGDSGPRPASAAAAGVAQRRTEATRRHRPGDPA